MDSGVQSLINQVSNEKSNLKSKIQSVLGKNLSGVTFENYYRYITTSSSLNPSRGYSSVDDTIAGKLRRLNQVKQFIRDAIEDELGQNLNGVAFTSYHNYIKLSYSLTGQGTTNIYQGWEYRVKLTSNGNPVSGANVSITINNVNYNKTTDSNGIARLTLNLNPSTYSVKSSYSNASLTESVKINNPISTSMKSAGNVNHGSDNPSRGRAWSNLSTSTLGTEDANSYASCENIAGSNGTYNTPYYVDCKQFNFGLPSGATPVSMSFRVVAKMNKGSTNAGQFSVSVMPWVDYLGVITGPTTSAGTLAKSQGTNWQYFTPSCNITGKYDQAKVNNSNFNVRVIFGTNQTTNPCNIDLTYVGALVNYVPAQ